MAMVKVNIQCPCGALLLSKLISDSNSSSGTEVCRACKKRCKWDIVNGSGFAGYAK